MSLRRRYLALHLRYIENLVRGFLEKVYVTALIYELIDRGLSAIAERNAS